MRGSGFLGGDAAIANTETGSDGREAATTAVSWGKALLIMVLAIPKPIPSQSPAFPQDILPPFVVTSN